MSSTNNSKMDLKVPKFTDQTLQAFNMWLETKYLPLLQENGCADPFTHPDYTWTSDRPERDIVGGETMADFSRRLSLWSDYSKLHQKAIGFLMKAVEGRSDIIRQDLQSIDLLHNKIAFLRERFTVVSQVTADAAWFMQILQLGLNANTVRAFQAYVGRLDDQIASHENVFKSTRTFHAFGPTTAYATEEARTAFVPEGMTWQDIYDMVEVEIYHDQAARLKTIVQSKLLVDLPDSEAFAILKHEWAPRGIKSDGTLKDLQDDLHSLLERLKSTLGQNGKLANNIHDSGKAEKGKHPVVQKAPKKGGIQQKQLINAMKTEDFQTFTTSSHFPATQLVADNIPEAEDDRIKDLP
ncbi:hypothetical protein HK101_003375, partial [Irineochytrium annulatum]